LRLWPSAFLPLSTGATPNRTAVVDDARRRAWSAFWKCQRKIRAFEPFAISRTAVRAHPLDRVQSQQSSVIATLDATFRTIPLIFPALLAHLVIMTWLRRATVAGQWLRKISSLIGALRQKGAPESISRILL